MNQAGSLTDEFLTELVQELDNEYIVGIALGGSYARGEATRYSDVDLACFWREGLRPPPKHLFYHQDRLISVKKTSVSEIRGVLSTPQSAIFFAGGQFRLLLDKDGSVASLLQEIENFRWEKLQSAADWSINLWMMLKAEDIQKVLREFQQDNETGLTYVIAKLVAEMTLLVAMHHGTLIISDSTYYRQVEEAAGNDSAWTLYHRIATGLEAGPTEIAPLGARGLAALHLYRATLDLVRPVMQKEALDVAEQVIQIVRKAADQLPFTKEEYQWLNTWI